MTLVTELSQVCDNIILTLRENEPELGVADDSIYYGDQERIPRSPAVCVEPNLKDVELYGAGRMTEVTLSVYVLVYHSELRAVESNRRDADKLAESIAKLLNSDATFGGSAIHCYVTKAESGYSTKQNTTLRSTRITFQVQSQERLPNNP